MVMTSAELIVELAPVVEKQTGCFHSHSWQLSLKVI